MRGTGALSRFLPGTAALGIVARLAAWPLLFVGARAMSPSRYLVLGILLATGLVALGIPRTRRAAIASGLLVAVPAFAAAHAAAHAMGLPAPSVVALLVAAGAAGALVRATLAYTATTLDAPTLALAPVAMWLAFAALQARFGGEAVHLHELVTPVTTAIAALGAAMALVGVAATAALRAWVRAVAAGTSASHRVGAIPTDEGPPLPRLSDRERCDAALVEAGGAGPYRSATRAAVALVPASLDVLVKRYGRDVAMAAMVLVSSGATAAALASSAPRVAHGPTVDDAPLPPLPGACRARPPTVVFVPTADLTAVDVHAVAARYSAVSGMHTTVAAPVPLDPQLYETQRGQLVGEEVLTRALADVPASPDRIYIVLTDRDMFLEGESWRYAFAYRGPPRGEHPSPPPRAAIISVARMAEDFAWWQHRSVGAPTPRPACGVVLDGRAYKMITRQILFTACGAAPSRDPGSVLRASIMSLADLDAVDERSF